MKPPKIFETGQIVVILAVAFMALLGFAALAIDVGMVYSDRRYDQSVADAAALAGAQAAALSMETPPYVVTYTGGGTGEVLFSCPAGNNPYTSGGYGSDLTLKAMKEAADSARQRVTSNNFPTTTDLGTVDTNLSDGMGVQVLCGADAKGSYTDKYLNIKVMITSQTRTSFAHLFFGGKMINTVTAETRVRPRMRSEYGYAIVALKPVCEQNKGTFNFNGGGDIKITGGGLFTNGCYNFGGTSLSVDAPSIGWAGGPPIITGSPTFVTASPPLNPLTPLPYTPITEPNCSGLTARTMPTGHPNVIATIQPGIYAGGITVNNNDVITMMPGLYCLDDIFNINYTIKVDPASLASDSNAGVTIFMRSGRVDVTANGDLLLQAPGNNTYQPALDGVLFYIKDTNSCNTDNAHSCVSIQGSASSVVSGTIWAPKGDVVLSGDSTMGSEFATQVIGYTVTINGGVTIDIQYEDDNAAPIPANLNMQR